MYVMTLPCAETIAISGISGRFPNCATVEEFKYHLLKGTDLITDNHQRWPWECLDLPSRLGIVPDLDRFDASCFGISPKAADSHDPKLRKLLEVVFEAIVDSGENPAKFRGSNTGVFLGITSNLNAPDNNTADGILNRATSIIANTISFCFDLKGPSYAIDTGCSSSLYALDQAVCAINRGSCDQAIVCAAQIHLDPCESIEFAKLGVINKEGRCKTFCQDRDGYVKADSVVAVFIRKTTACRRIYSYIAGTGTNVDGFKNDGILRPSNEMQRTLLENIYETYKIDRNEIEYLEAHGTGTVVGDIEEAKAIVDFFCDGKRSKPLLVGSVKTNAGHAEIASGLVSIVKVIISMQTGVIPANLGFDHPAKDVSGISDGLLKVVTQNTPYNGGLIGINSFGFGGANAHIILRPFIETTPPMPLTKPRLIQVSGRTEQAVETLLSAVTKNTNLEFLTLIDHIFNESPIENHNYRGYTVIPTGNKKFEINKFTNGRPVWFFYSGMGSQWPGMARDLMQFDVFKETMKKCADALKPFDLDLEDIVNNEETNYDDCINCFTAIVAMEVSLTALIYSLGVKPDGIIGHSLGEIGCAYADGLFTVEQAILIAYARGYATCTSDLTPGLMASIGLSADDCRKLLPKDIYLACDNAPDNVTISGPVDLIKKFLEQLTNDGIFNKLINTAGYAFHSKYIHDAGQKMLDFIKTHVRIEKQMRSNRWLPSAIHESQWDTDLGKFHSGEYHWFNFMNPVQFCQLLKYVPKDAILIEIAPRDLFRAIFKRCSDVSYMNLVASRDQEKSDNNFENVLCNFGKLYNNGVQTNLLNLYKSIYQSIKFPVSSTVPLISSLIKWDHIIKWKIPEYHLDKPFGEKFVIDINNPEDRYLTGHIVDGRVIFPATGYLVLAWRTLAKLHSKHFKHLPVIFENIKILEASFLTTNKPSSFFVNICHKGGDFVIYSETRTMICKGRIFVPKAIDEEFLNYNHLPKLNNHAPNLNQEDFYKELHLRGYDYHGSFRGVKESSIDGRFGVLSWIDNWVTFLDTILQHVVLKEQSLLFVPTLIEKISIDPQRHQHFIALNKNTQEKEIFLDYNKILGVALCGGVEIRKIHGKIIEKRKTNLKPSLLKYCFVSNQKLAYPLFDLMISVQIVAENFWKNLKICEIQSDNALFEDVRRLLPKSILKRAEILKITTELLKSDCDLVIDLNSSSQQDIINFARNSEFIFTNLTNFDGAYFSHFGLVSVYKTDFSVLLKRSKDLPQKFAIIQASNENFTWIEQLKESLKKHQNNPHSRVYLVSTDYNSGIVGLFNCLRHENGCQNLRIYFLRDGVSENFNLNSTFFVGQVKKDLTVNVLSGGVWGSWKLLPLESLEKNVVEEAFMRFGENNKLEWVEQKKSKTVAVYYASLDLTDLTSSFEFSGVQQETKARVMGICKRGPISTSLDPNPNLIWEIPSKWSLEAAAATTKTYVLVLYSLFFKSNLRSDKSILIHHGTNKFSLAAIALALNENSDVYVTVAKTSQKKDLMKLFPLLDENRIMLYPGKIIFSEVMLQATNGRGVDLVFNCQSKKLVGLSLQCVVKFGHIININSDDFHVDDKKCFCYEIDVNDIFEDDSLLPTVSNKFENYLRLGVIKPLNYQLIDTIDDVKIPNSDDICILKVKEKQGFFSRVSKKFLAQTEAYFSPEKSYVIVGGLGGFGLELVKWLISKGVRKIILNGRRGVTTGYQNMCLQKWRKSGNIVLIDTCDVTSITGATNLIEFANNLGEVGGIFNLALVLKDDLFFEQTVDNFCSVIAPKVRAVQHFDYLSRKLCKSLDYFVCFSSMVSSLGNATQSNYGYANSAIERICETRKGEGLPGLAVEWGPIGDVGFVARLQTNVRFLEAVPQGIVSCLDVLDGFLQRREPVVVSCVFGDGNDYVVEGVKKTNAMEAVVGFFGIKDLGEVDEGTSLINLGLDSLLSFEIRNLLSSDFNVEISVEELKKCTIKELKELIKDKCLLSNLRDQTI